MAYFNVVTVPHKMVRLERMSDYRGVIVTVSRDNPNAFWSYVH